jgi:hypothetical protein
MEVDMVNLELAENLKMGVLPVQTTKVAAARRISTI